MSHIENFSYCVSMPGLPRPHTRNRWSPKAIGKERPNTVTANSELLYHGQYAPLLDLMAIFALTCHTFPPFGHPTIMTFIQILIPGEVYRQNGLTNVVGASGNSHDQKSA